MARWTEAQIPDLSGQTILVTGANSGLGLNTTRALAAHGAHVLMACRNADKAKEARLSLLADQPDARLTIKPLDLGSLVSVRALAADLKSEGVTLSGLINNAGVMAVPHGHTRDGFEIQMGTNHLGHFALTGLLLDRLLPGARIVNVASMAHRWTPGINFDDLHWDHRRYRRWQAYGDSKLANLLFTFELHRWLVKNRRDALSVAAHPGYADTHLQFVAAEVKQSKVEHWGMTLANAVLAQPAAMGALPSLYAATAAGVVSGDYIGPGGFQQMRGYPAKVGCRKAAKSEALAQRLWAISEAATGVRFGGG